MDSRELAIAGGETGGFSRGVSGLKKPGGEKGSFVVRVKKKGLRRIDSETKLGRKIDRLRREAIYSHQRGVLCQGREKNTHAL